MKIGKQVVPSSGISTANGETIVVHGKDLCTELVGKISFTDYFWLLCTGSMPSEAQSTIVDAALVAVAEHGLVPSVIASRMTLAAAPEAFQGAVAAGLLGCGSVILGSAEAAGIFLSEVLQKQVLCNGDLSAAAGAAVKALVNANSAIPGYGHPLHKLGDPRAATLIKLTRDCGIATPHVDAAEAVEKVIPLITGKSLLMNVSVALPAVLLDVGFPLRGLKGIPLLARTAGLIGHMIEEMANPIGFALSYQAAQHAKYTGAVPDNFIASK